MRLVTIPNPRPRRGGSITLEWLYSNTLSFPAPPELKLKEPCRIWQGAITKHNGYASISENGIGRVGHRLSYRLHVGDIPEGKVLDHLCRVRSCIEPTHLEPVPGKVNTQRGLSCMKGQPCKTCGGSRFSSNRKRHRVCLDCRKKSDAKVRKKSTRIQKQSTYDKRYREKKSARSKARNNASVRVRRAVSKHGLSEERPEQG